MAETKQVLIPDIGDFKDVPIIEVLVKPGDSIKAEDSLIVLESDKATIEVPSPFAGIIRELSVKVGDKVSEGSPILTLEASEAEQASPAEQREVAPASTPAPAPTIASPEQAPRPATQSGAQPQSTAQPQPSGSSPRSAFVPSPIDEATFAKAHASPSVRRFARELGVNLALVKGNGPKQRILKEDVQAFVKAELSKPRGGGTELNLLPWPQPDFAKFGPVEFKPLSRIKKISGANLHRNWVMIPHVTQFDEADITELETLRKETNESSKEEGVKVTLLAFLLRASIAVLKKFPEFNASLTSEGDEMNLVVKNYYHLGFAADTPHGLVVPVIRDVDKKGVIAIAKEMSDLAAWARAGKLKPTDMQGASFTISSLGGIGGTAFTPIINAPEVAILGVSRAVMKPVYRDGEFVPRLMLPLSLSYDHRVIDGATAARFTTHLVEVLADLRRVLL
ncbi:pyruvate dehydrogenase E2 component (dihydrolipoamide acetyltransferase) [Nitrosospira multiformis]|uniref:Acetyltransferase component of pyruvate dehydrogenase complex n=1 Tax=Nitrosospira multiformis TaxID=1231 RepID=A0A1H8DK00_9PROT|nr:dihydrolipoyllysine-residue acetyltransferase [Nitrosospira multiformis]SEN07543.1 pyruvate dehydrogenase E2 component (dihydrolipoamide acetyltransferase) [Nitrosospira multiformis]